MKQKRKPYRPDLYAIASTIVARWKSGEVFNSLCKQYKCTHNTMQRVILSVVPFSEYIKVIVHREQQNLDDFAKRQSKRRAPIGTIAIKKERERNRVYYRKIIKVSYDQNAYMKGWKALAIYNWEKAHGPVPPGYVVVHIDGNHQNDDISNLAIKTRRELMLSLVSTQSWREAVKAGAANMSEQTNARRIKRSVATRKRNRRIAQQEAEDRGRIAQIREIIPVPSCVSERMQSGWWDNREDDDE